MVLPKKFGIGEFLGDRRPDGRQTTGVGSAEEATRHRRDAEQVHVAAGGEAGHETNLKSINLVVN